MVMVMDRENYRGNCYRLWANTYQVGINPRIDKWIGRLKT